MGKHTPGEWAAKGQYVFAGPDCIGICDTDNASEERCEANARIMAAAPDLLEALKAARVVVEADGARATLAIVDAAIAKAEGL